MTHVEGGEFVFERGFGLKFRAVVETVWRLLS